jgi:hypothetical protein
MYQTFAPHNSSSLYFRTWSGSAWNAWIDLTAVAAHTHSGEIISPTSVEFPRQSSAPATPGSAGARIYTFNADGNTVLEGKTETGGTFRFLRDQLLIGRNNTGSTIAAGVAVKVTGWDATSGVVTIALASNDALANMPAIGITTASIANNTSGRVWQIGLLTGMDTSSFSVGDELYLGASGALTATRPTSPTAYVQFLGTVLVSHASTGQIYMNISPHYQRVGNPVPIVLFDGGTTLATSALADVGAWIATTKMAGTLTEVRGRLRTASSSGSVTAVVTLNGTTTIGTLTFTSGSLTSNTLTPNQAIAAGDWITVHVTGAGTGAKMLTVVGELMATVA